MMEEFICPLGHITKSGTPFEFVTCTHLLVGCRCPDPHHGKTYCGQKASRQSLAPGLYRDAGTTTPESKTP